MSKLEINAIFKFKGKYGDHYMPCGLNIVDKLWWRFMPGVIINVKWPRGDIVVDHSDPRWRDMGGAVWVNLGFSADPNDHYRPWLEKHVGKQSWNWQWGMGGEDVTENRLTIKFRRGKEQQAVIAALRWA